MNTKLALKFNFLLLCLVTVLTFSSCSDDDDSDSTISGTVALASSALGDYTGPLFDTDGQTLNVDTTATITETSSETYTISFDNNVPSVVGLTFTATAVDGTFTSTNTNTIVVIATNSEILTVSQIDTENPLFAGGR